MFKTNKEPLNPKTAKDKATAMIEALKANLNKSDAELLEELKASDAYKTAWENGSISEMSLKDKLSPGNFNMLAAQAAGSGGSGHDGHAHGNGPAVRDGEITVPFDTVSNGMPQIQLLAKSVVKFVHGDHIPLQLHASGDDAFPVKVRAAEHQLRKTFQRIIFTNHRDHYAVGRCQCADGQDAK